MINVKVNQEKHQFPETSNLQFILNELKIAQNGIAVAINEMIISKEEWDTITLKNNDNILIIKATQGG